MARAEKKPYVDFGGRVPREAFEEFRAKFPQYGATNWLVNEMLERFNSRVRENPSAIEIVDQAIDDFLNRNQEKPVSAGGE